MKKTYGLSYGVEPLNMWANRRVVRPPRPVLYFVHVMIKR